MPSVDDRWRGQVRVSGNHPKVIKVAGAPFLAGACADYQITRDATRRKMRRQERIIGLQHRNIMLGIADIALCRCALVNRDHVELIEVRIVDSKERVGIRDRIRQKVGTRTSTT